MHLWYVKYSNVKPYIYIYYEEDITSENILARSRSNTQYLQNDSIGWTTSQYCTCWKKCFFTGSFFVIWS